VKVIYRSIKNTLKRSIALTVMGLCLLWSDGVGAQNQENRSSLHPAAEKNERSRAHLYFADKKNLYLTAQERVMIDTETAEDYGSGIVRELIKGPMNGLMRTIPSETVLRAFFILNNGTAYVDLSDEAGEGHPGGVQMERLTIYSIVNSLVLNVSEIQMVKILINGEDALTLAGHIDLRLPLKAEMLLIR
jgi:spore germination protein GerM